MVIICAKSKAAKLCVMLRNPTVSRRDEHREGIGDFRADWPTNENRFGLLAWGPSVDGESVNIGIQHVPHSIVYEPMSF